MRAYVFVTVLLKLTLSTHAASYRHYRQPKTIASVKPQLEPSPNVVADETINLIHTGRQSIHLSPSYKNAVLLVGNTGAGKTTLAKFLSGKPLESYPQGGRNLIKDSEGKISFKSTLVSKTIFPEMFVDDESGTAYYDLPGFSDTRNASVELANAWFMKMVADHVKKVKIVFIVTHSSLRSGESRNDLKTLLDHATSFLLNPTKFHSAIALVASKVDTYIPDNTVARDIAEFLAVERANIHNIFGADENKLRQVDALLDAFLVQGDGGIYDRIGYFKQPEEVGPLDKMPYMKLRRSALKTMVEHNLQFQKKKTKDFGISVSDNARFFIRTIVEKLSSKLTELIVSLANAVRSHYHQMHSQNSGLGSFAGRMVKEVAMLDSMTNDLQKSPSRLSFIQVLQQRLPLLPITNSTLKELLIHHENLEFYEKIDSRSVVPISLEWVDPLRIVVYQLKLEISNMAQSLTREVNSWVGEIVSSLQKTYDQVIADGLNADDAKQGIVEGNLASDKILLERLQHDLQTKQSVNSFLNVTNAAFGSLSIKPARAPNQPPLLADDIAFQDHPQISSDSWIRTISQLLLTLSSKESSFLRALQTKRHEAGLSALASNLTHVQKTNAEQSKQAEKDIQNLQAQITSFQKSIAAKENEVKELQKKMEKSGTKSPEVAQALKAMQDSLEQMKINELRSESTIKLLQEEQKRLERERKEMQDRLERDRREQQERDDRRAREQSPAPQVRFIPVENCKFIKLFAWCY